VTNTTWLRDATGNPVWSGVVNDGRYAFTCRPTPSRPASATNCTANWAPPGRRATPQGWNASAMFTHYQMLRDANRQASLPQPQADLGGAGTVTRRDGTGWNTLELQTTYTPTANDFGGGRHALVFGLHRNSYQLDNVVNKSTDWRRSESTMDQSYYGKTTITALYGQDAWRFAPDWMLTSGLRLESFEASDGSQYFAGPPVAQQAFAKRSLHDGQPQAVAGLDGR
jgi:iron complex outermembrane receptor protein